MSGSGKIFHLTDKGRKEAAKFQAGEPPWEAQDSRPKR